MPPKIYTRLAPNSVWRLPEPVISKVEANKLNMIPLTIGCLESEYWILHNIMQDCLRANINYCFVKGVQGVEIWKGTVKHNRQS